MFCGVLTIVFLNAEVKRQKFSRSCHLNRAYPEANSPVVVVVVVVVVTKKSNTIVAS